MQTGVVNIDNNLYYFNTDGSLVTNSNIEYNAKVYDIDDKGILIERKIEENKEENKEASDNTNQNNTSQNNTSQKQDSTEADISSSLQDKNKGDVKLIGPGQQGPGL